VEYIYSGMTVATGLWSALAVLALLFGGVALGWLSDTKRSEGFRLREDETSAQSPSRRAA